MVGHTEIVETFCHQCHMKCRVQVELRDGVIRRIRDATCEKGSFAHEEVYHPDRLRHPLRRAGDRGQCRWERISWDEALDLMARELGRILSQHGPESICGVTGCLHKEPAAVAGMLFAYLLGTPNVMDANLLCTTPAAHAEFATFGGYLSGDIGPDYGRARSIVLWGANPRATRPPMDAEIRKRLARGPRGGGPDVATALERGIRLIVIDPRPTSAARKAHLWLRPRPGTDAALALAMIHTVIEEELYDRGFVERWCVGFEALRERAAGYPPERVADLCWVAPDEIRLAARSYATVRPACMHTRLGAASMQVNATQTSRAIACLMALVGDIDVPGGNLIPDLRGFKVIYAMRNEFRVPPEVEARRFGAREFPLNCGTRESAPFRYAAHNPTAIKAMLSGEVKALYIPGNNMVVQEPDSREVWEALRRLEFLVVADHFLTPTAELADLVLPAAHWLECESVTNAFTGDYHSVMATRPAVLPRGEARDDRQIVLDLARRMGIDSPWRSVEDLNNLRLAAMGLSMDDLRDRPGRTISIPVAYRKFEQRGFRTPSGKVELASSLFARAGYDPLPSHREPPESPLMAPELSADYPLILIQSRHRVYEHSEYRQLASLRERCPDPELELAPELADELGIAHGDPVWVETPRFRDRVRARAVIARGMHPRVVSVLHGWWFPEQEGPEHGCFEANINTIICRDGPFDPINGNPQVRAIPCRVGRG